MWTCRPFHKAILDLGLDLLRIGASWASMKNGTTKLDPWSAVWCIQLLQSCLYNDRRHSGQHCPVWRTKRTFGHIRNRASCRVWAPGSEWLREFLQGGPYCDTGLLSLFSYFHLFHDVPSHLLPINEYTEHCWMINVFIYFFVNVFIYL